MKDTHKADVIELLDAHSVVYVKGVQRIILPCPIEMIVDKINATIREDILHFTVASDQGVAEFAYRGNFIVHWTMLPTGPETVLDENGETT